MLLIHSLVCFGPVSCFGDNLLFLMVRKCFRCCCERVPDWIRVVQWWLLIYSPRRAHLAQARITGTRPIFLLERSPRRGAVFWATNCLAQARRPRLSESSRNYPRATIAVSPKRESAAWARALFSPEQGLQLERDLFWVFAMLCFMNVDGCLIGWFIDLLSRNGVDMHVVKTDLSNYLNHQGIWID